MKRAVMLAGVILAATTCAWAQGPAGSEEKLPKIPRKHLVLGMPGFELGDDTRAPRQCRVVAEAVPGTVVLLAPKMTRFYGLSPLFRWSGAPGKDGFEVAVFDENGQEILRRRVRESHYRPQASQPVFEEGKTYSWSVRPIPDTANAVPCEAAFQVLVGKEHRQVEKELASISSPDRYEFELVRAQILTNHRLWYDAIGAYSALIERFPDRAEPYEKRGSIYAQLDETKPLGDADLARADELKAQEQR